MSYGAHVHDSRPKTKKMLKQAVADNPARVHLDTTSMFGGFAGRLDRAPAGRYDVVGPDPYTKRNWYATVEVRPDGTIKVS